jgi:hypothetical protein
MELQKDFNDLFELFNAHDVLYMIIGGYALRATEAAAKLVLRSVVCGPRSGNGL